jgi:hypothetical protein
MQDSECNTVFKIRFPNVGWAMPTDRRYGGLSPSTEAIAELGNFNSKIVVRFLPRLLHLHFTGYSLRSILLPLVSCILNPESQD